MADFIKHLLEHGFVYPKGETPSEHIITSFFPFSHGLLNPVTYEPLAKKDFELLQRFARVFEQTYRRFLDLKQAEAQAREAQIEAALERVRSRTMAMHESNELAETAAVLFQQFNELGIAPERSFIGIINEEAGEFEIWVTEQGGNQISNSFIAAIDEPTTVAKVFLAWKEGESSIIIDLHGEELSAWVQYVREQMGMPFQEIRLREHRFHCAAFFSQGMLGVTTPDKRPPETMSILERFAGVFDLTYRRFLDLKKAEEQAREAQIEAALERVRAKAMAMHHSDDLHSAAAAIFSALKDLGLRPVRSGIVIVTNEQTEEFEIWTTTSSSQGEAIQLAGRFLAAENPFMKRSFEHWQRQEAFWQFDLSGDELDKFLQTLLARYLPHRSESGGSPALPKRQVFHYFSFLEGVLFAVADESFSTEDLRILQKFTRVLTFAYTRFLDLQQAEARAREAEQQASLDRVRAEIASMRTAGDLQRITPLIWRELTTLGVPFFRCGVFIIAEATEYAHVYLSTPSGEAVAALHLKFDSAPVVKAAVQHWRQQQVYREEWNREQFIAWTRSLIEQGMIESLEKYQGGGEAPEKLVLQFVPFTQGMLYIGTSSALSHDEIEIGQALAKAFGIAYAPTVTVSTRYVNGRVEIRVRDNGGGIPDEVREKIFEPFFTTKPAGSGTGLGLSLSYDIVTQGHGGTLTVESTKGEGATLIITLPAH